MCADLNTSMRWETIALHTTLSIVNRHSQTSSWSRNGWVLEVTHDARCVHLASKLLTTLGRYTGKLAKKRLVQFEYKCPHKFHQRMGFVCRALHIKT